MVCNICKSNTIDAIVEYSEQDSHCTKREKEGGNNGRVITETISKLNLTITSLITRAAPLGGSRHMSSSSHTDRWTSNAKSTYRSPMKGN